MSITLRYQNVGCYIVCYRHHSTHAMLTGERSFSELLLALRARRMARPLFVIAARAPRYGHRHKTLFTPYVRRNRCAYVITTYTAREERYALASASHYNVNCALSITGAVVEVIRSQEQHSDRCRYERYVIRQQSCYVIVVNHVLKSGYICHINQER